MISPSLQTSPDDSSPAYEMKFLLTEEQAIRVEAELSSRLVYDPHATSGRRPGEYRTTTLYFDTPDFDVYYRRGGHARRKFRLRRYGDSSTAFLERKAKQGLHVKKRRTSVSLIELNRLQNSTTEINWEGDWFHRRILLRQLSPVMLLTYDRIALVGVHEGNPVRATFDRSIRSLPASGLHLNSVEGGTKLLSDRVICELKYREALPEPFKSLIFSQQLVPGKASKYRLGLEVSRIIAGPEQ